MSKLLNTAWYEGMTLDPHHFQQWNRYYQSVLRTTYGTIVPYGWGLLSLKVNEEAVNLGEFSLEECRGIMRDGLVFDAPAYMELPEDRSIAPHFPPAGNSLSVFLTVPSEQEDGKNTILPGETADRETRFEARATEIIDENTGRDRRSVVLKHPRLQVKFGSESLDAYNTVEITRLRRNSVGKFVVDPAFIPPVLQVGASPTLMLLIKKLSDLFVAKHASLSQQFRSVRDWQRPEIQAAVIHAGLGDIIPLLAHVLEARVAHPESVFLTLERVIGRLMTFVERPLDFKLADLPAYNHDRLTDLFSTLDGHARTILKALQFDDRVDLVPLDQVNPSTYVARQLQARILDKSLLYLEVTGAKNQFREVSSKIKIASPEAMTYLVGGALPALPLRLANEPPAGMSAQTDTNYFQLIREGVYWDNIVAEKAIELFVPSELQHIGLKLYAVYR